MASDVKKRGDAKVKDEGGNVLESTMVPSQPQRPKSKEGVESPRVLRPQPPAGISSRTDVDIYRYSQGAEQRMAIRPLFEQRRDSSGETRSASAKRKGKRAVKKGEVETGARVDAEDGGDADALKKPESEDDKRTVLEDDENEQQGGVSNQDNVRASSPTCDDCLGASIADQDLIEIVEDKTSDFDEESRTTAVENVGPTLLKKLDASSYHEPFLQTDGPKLSWLREVIETASPAPTTVANPNLNRQCGQNRDVVVYKTLAKDMRTLGGKSVLVTVLLNSRGAVQITCKCNGSTDQNIVDFSESDLEQSLLLRPDLQVRTPKWAEWIITKVRCDSRMIYFVDFADAEESEKRVCFSESIHIGGNDIAVEMIALPSASSLLISVRDATSRVKQADILLRLEDLRRLAISLGKISSVENTDQEVTALLGDHEFLSQLATKSNVINVGMSCTGFTNELKPSLRSNGCPAKSTDMTADVPANMNLLKRVELLDPPNYVQDLLEENKLIGIVALLVQAYVENGVLSALRHFQQQEAVQLNVAAFMQQAAGIDSESAFDERVERNLEAARMSKLRVRTPLIFPNV
ncbi:unnamed protein product [Phytophthora lilii]|uniref:Unnamed protein product n=1 Tax=Phytophthora lilii TaxID=2077276 RepID=A0A9W6WTJ3_9STRA|nr:unnamed protein product [Phytophthora lilii]